MTFRELVDQECEIVFGEGILAIRCLVKHDGDDCLTVSDVSGAAYGHKVLVPKAAIKYVRLKATTP